MLRELLSTPHGRPSPLPCSEKYPNWLKSTSQSTRLPIASGSATARRISMCREEMAFKKNRWNQSSVVLYLTICYGKSCIALMHYRINRNVYAFRRKIKANFFFNERLG
jgi:hypothetical protein